MRLKLGLAIGFAVGYYFGAKAGRTRYVQLRRWIDTAKGSDVFETATDKARAVVDLGVERARDLMDRHNDDPVVIDLAAGGSYSPSR
ncbi:MAG: hypothetical protein QOC92_4422 [Acidimicrobiaceae bacterium]|jgi:hypothetical protein